MARPSWRRLIGQVPAPPEPAPVRLFAPRSAAEPEPIPPAEMIETSQATPPLQAPAATQAIPPAPAPSVGPTTPPVDDAISETDYVESLYRGVLNREPDATGVTLHVKFLRETGGGPRGLARVVRNFVHSDEFVGNFAREALERQAASPLDTTTGPVFRHAISLGSHCYTSMLLKRQGLKRYSLPFDWIFSSLRTVAHALDDDFATLLDRAEFELIPEAQRSLPNEQVGRHRFYEREFGVETMFNHQDLTDDVQHEYFVRASARMRRILATPEPKLFLAITTENTIRQGDFELLLAALERHTRNFRLFCVRVLEPSNDFQEFGFQRQVEIGDHVLTRYQPVSRMLGLQFTHPLDDFMLKRQLATMRFDLDA